MCPRSSRDLRQLPPELLCLIQKSDLSADDLRKIYSYAQVNPSHLVPHINRLDILVTKGINPVECSCSNKNYVHFDFSCKNVENDAKLQLAAACFSTFPFLKYSSQRFREFQLRLSKCLCDSLCCLLDIHGLSHTTLSAVQMYLNSEVDHFSFITPMDKVKRLPEDFFRLLIMRVDFFVFCLRYIFTRDSSVHINLCLPLLMSIFNGFFEVRLTDVVNIPGSLLASSTRLMLCLDTICQVVSTLLMPAVPCLLTLLTYHLEWTENWRLESKNIEYFVRLRLAVLSCLLHLAARNLKFSYTYFVDMIPRIFPQLAHDLQGFSTCLCTYSVTLTNDAPKSQVTSPGLFEKRLLLGVLLLTERIFKDPEVLWYMEISRNKCPMNSDCTTNNISVNDDVSHLLQCINSLISRINVILNCGTSSAQRQNKLIMTLLSPRLLISLANASSACAISTHSQVFHVTVLKFLASLTKHSDSAVSLTALSNHHQLCGVNVNKFIGQENFATNTISHTEDQLGHQTRLVLPEENFDAVGHISEVHHTSTEDSNCQQNEPPAKRCRTMESQGVVQITTEISYEGKKTNVLNENQEEDLLTSGEQAVCYSDVNSLLTTFDPTFM
ncbi:hypothetical protein MN116_007042 [Schistosoma mekongi]|uniref:DUF5742 domain-containing protein n=1 Tax=Schistosoma mekongi TaxID=38744 RepID=A0AAE2D320_SCHME|nr:hypothetical protein MN116_007042 [Schistosoma mekongi]